MQQLINAVQRSSAVTVSSYVLTPYSPMGEAIVQAHRNGSETVVVLDSEGVGDAVRNKINQSVIDFQQRGVTMRLSNGASHLKSALIDRRVVYLSDRNFTSSGAIVLASDDPDDYNAVVDAIARRPGAGSAHLRVYKRDALALEASIINGGQGTLYCETESLSGVIHSYATRSSQNPALDALVARAARSKVFLIVSGDEYDDGQHDREHELGHELQRRGVEVRVGHSNEKMAIDSSDAFVGSANMSGGSDDVQSQPDFGMEVSDSTITAALRQHFDADWRAAQPAP